MPTRRGWLVAGTGALLLAVGAASAYQELALLGGLGLAAVLAAVLLVGRPPEVGAERSIPGRRSAPGAELRVRLNARNPGRRAVQISERIAGAGGEQAIGLAPLAPHATGGSDYRITAARRGVIELGPLRVGRSDPFGLAALHRSYGGTDRIWVHPRWERLRAVPVGRVADPDGSADGARSGTLTFHTLRDYVPGDDLRHVHWRSSAKLDKLVVREYVDTSRTRVCVLVDDRPTPGGDARLDEVAGAAASILATGVHAALHCELLLVSGRGRASTGGLAPLLDLLAEAAPTADADLGRALRLARTRPSGDTAVLVSGALSDADMRLFGRLRAHYAGLLAVAVGPEERPAAPAGVTLLTAGDAAGLSDRWNEAPWSR
ncbi:DUF58 domain-containing protein [Streptomonospora sediminis]